jgi:hypothetical protein
MIQFGRCQERLRKLDLDLFRRLLTVPTGTPSTRAILHTKGDFRSTAAWP